MEFLRTVVQLREQFHSLDVPADFRIRVARALWKCFKEHFTEHDHEGAKYYGAASPGPCGCVGAAGRRISGCALNRWAKGDPRSFAALRMTRLNDSDVLPEELEKNDDLRIYYDALYISHLIDGNRRQTMPENHRIYSALQQFLEQRGAQR